MKTSKNPKISVIITVNNAAKYLSRCLDSLVYQTYENLEIICIVNGSTDSSLQILEEYKAKDPRVKVYTQENKKPGALKNYGMAVSTGEYISFADSEDWSLLTLYETFVNLTPKGDIYCFNVESYAEDTKEPFTKRFYDISVWQNHRNESTVHTIRDCSDPLYLNLGIYNKIYDAHFLKQNDIKFLEETDFEDFLFHVETFFSAKSIFVTDKTFCRHRTDNNSKTQTCGEEVFQIFDVIEKIEKTIRDSGMYEESKYALLQFKYEQLHNLFEKTKFSLKEKFFKGMQETLKKIDMTRFDPDIYEKLTGINKFYNILNSDWAAYALGHRFPKIIVTEASKPL